MSGILTFDEAALISSFNDDEDLRSVEQAVNRFEKQTTDMTSTDMPSTGLDVTISRYCAIVLRPESSEWRPL